MKRYLEIIVPIWNEEKNLVPLVKRINSALKRARISYRIFFVDDNSTDESLSVLKELKLHYPINVLSKVGERGKAYSILEAVPQTRSDYLVMIDGDLQYPPEAIPEMFEMALETESGVVIAKRGYRDESMVRKVLHFGFGLIFAKLISKFDYDVQSGLKLFKREVIEKIDAEEVTPWTIDLPLIYSSLNLGYGIAQTGIDFARRVEGKSKVHFLKSSLEIGKSALRLKRKQKKVISFSDSEDSMLHAGVVFRGKRFVTHTTLDPHRSAIETFYPWQKRLLIVGSLAIVLGLVFNFLLVIKSLVAILSILYFVDALFNFYMISRGLRGSPELSFSEKQIGLVQDKELPVYTILCPLYREAAVLPTFLQAIENLDWPKNKLDVQLLLEEDDQVTQEAAKQMELPSYVRVQVVPHSFPKTKPKACNFGLSHARGEYLVIYDAEDIPEPNQLKKAYLGFKKLPAEVICLQAKLNYFNPHQNILTRLFTAEYSLWFDLVLPGFQSIQTNIPLGGTSNHFKIKKLREVKGWDPFNVTEDCDLGVRLFMHGYKTAIIDSTTLEEANSNLKNWVRQRSRWIKGYMQTYLVHMRSPLTLLKSEGVHGLIFQFVVGGKIASSLINPILWLTTLSYFIFYRQIGAAIESLYPPLVFYLSITAMLFGNFLYFYCYMIGVVKKEQYSLVKYVFLIPFYWVAISFASFVALYQLFVKPHYWEKTIHGLHLKEEKEKTGWIFSPFKPIFAPIKYVVNMMF